MVCPIQLNKEFAESLISLATIMRGQDRISLPIETEFNGNLSVQFKDGMITLSSTPKTVSVPVLHFDTEKVKAEIEKTKPDRMSALDRQSQLASLYGNQRFLRRDAAKKINPNNVKAGDQRLTDLAKKKLIVRSGSAPQGGHYWRVNA